jgi:phosphoenolpyruvate carboxykinase (ATP)
MLASADPYPPSVTDFAPESAFDLRVPGLINPGKVYANRSAAVLVEQALARKEGVLADNGALIAFTGTRTGRSPKDRSLVLEPSSRDHIWWSSVNRPMEPEVFERLYHRAIAYLQGRDLFVQDGYACADPKHRLNVRVVAEKAWHALFAHCLFLRPTPEELTGFEPQFTVLHAAGLHCDPAIDGTHSEAVIVFHLSKRIVLIAGTEYAGEIKKSVFSVLNYLLPFRDVFPMHCSANIGSASDAALFFGLSGTGKTTLSADPDRHLIGDDEHGWSADGIFNLEGGCYAKTIRLSPQGEPQIWNALRFGCVLENVVVDPRTRRPDYDDDSVTENTRAAYPIDFIANHAVSGRGGHPAHILFLTCDAFGVLPPLAKLTLDQAMYYFLSGYTAKVAGTEAGVTEPEATFSTCFAAPFLPLQPTRYADLFRERLTTHRSEVWLVNTGWTGGPYGEGRRFPLAHTRALLRAVLSGELNDVPCQVDPVFGVRVPERCPGVPSALLQPRHTWRDPAAYDAKARQLANLFQANFEKYAAKATPEVTAAGPRL